MNWFLWLLLHIKTCILWLSLYIYVFMKWDTPSCRNLFWSNELLFSSRADFFLFFLPVWWDPSLLLILVTFWILSENAKWWKTSLVVCFWTEFKVHSIQCSSRVLHMKAQAYLHNIEIYIYRLYIENNTTNKNNHLFYSSKKEETKREICIFTSFFSK